MRQCSKDNHPITNYNERSGCQGGGAYTCWDQAPFRDENDPGLSFGFVAVPARAGASCGSCFELRYTGDGYYVPQDPGSRKLKGKRMIVQATNIGADVFSGQMDLMIPGGGTGLFNGCTRQWGNHDLGATYGGFLSKCQNEHGAVCANNGGRLRCVGVEFPDAQHEEVKKCVRKMCGEIFEGRDELLLACHWFSQWFEAADNPNFDYRPIDCPEQLVARSGTSRG